MGADCDACTESRREVLSLPNSSFSLPWGGFAQLAGGGEGVESARRKI